MKILPLIGAALLLGLSGSLRAVDFSSTTFNGKRITVCQVDLRKGNLRLFLRDETGATFKRFDKLASWLAARGEKLIFAMNGGMYHGNFAPVGLFISEGKTLEALNLSDAPGNFFLKPNGVFLISKSGAKIVESSEFPANGKGVLLATQSGPLLVQHGRLHSAFQSGSTSCLFRNGVGIVNANTVVFAISEEPINFDEFARGFRDTLHCQDALFLDGTISSLYSPELKRSDFRMDLGPILGITEPSR
ncbi:MAG: phosphodiester glycosidase family protein [Chthoniobacterales bacterium]